MSVTTLIKSNIRELETAQQMLEQLSGEDFARPVEPLFQSSIGAHYRHILDHYHCFFAGLANGTIIFCLPGSPGACRTGWSEIIADQLDSSHKPCNFVDKLRLD